MGHCPCPRSFGAVSRQAGPQGKPDETCSSCSSPGPNSQAQTRRPELAGPNSPGQNSARPELCGARTPGARTPGPRTPGPRTRRARAKGHARPNAEKPDSGARARVQGIRSMGHAFPVRSRASRRRRSQSLARQLQRLPALARVDDAPQRARCKYGCRTSDCAAARTAGISRGRCLRCCRLGQLFWRLL